MIVRTLNTAQWDNEWIGNRDHETSVHVHTSVATIVENGIYINQIQMSFLR